MSWIDLPTFTKDYLLKRSLIVDFFSKFAINFFDFLITCLYFLLKPSNFLTNLNIMIST